MSSASVTAVRNSDVSDASDQGSESESESDQIKPESKYKPHWGNWYSKFKKSRYSGEFSLSELIDGISTEGYFDEKFVPTPLENLFSENCARLISDMAWCLELIKIKDKENYMTFDTIVSVKCSEDLQKLKEQFNYFLKTPTKKRDDGAMFTTLSYLHRRYLFAIMEKMEDSYPGGHPEDSNWSTIACLDDSLAMIELIRKSERKLPDLGLDKLEEKIKSFFMLTSTKDALEMLFPKRFLHFSSFCLGTFYRYPFTELLPKCATLNESSNDEKSPHWKDLKEKLTKVVSKIDRVTLPFLEELKTLEYGLKKGKPFCSTTFKLPANSLLGLLEEVEKISTEDFLSPVYVKDPEAISELKDIKPEVFNRPKDVTAHLNTEFDEIRRMGGAIQKLEKEGAPYDKVRELDKERAEKLAEAHKLIKTHDLKGFEKDLEEARG